MGLEKEFELLVAELYRRKGYKVELEKTLVGESGAYHRFDSYCTKGFLNKKILALEAKYSAIGLPVRLDDFCRFVTAVNDCEIREAHMVTNSYFSENILSLAIAYNIRLVDGETLRKELRKYRMDEIISTSGEILVKIGIPIAKLVLDSIDGSKTLSKILLPKNRPLYLSNWKRTDQ